jgi:uncharacterized protein (DUF433 family)
MLLESSMPQIQGAKGRTGGLIVTDHVGINPEVRLGKPMIRGTRVLVEFILETLSEARYGVTAVSGSGEAIP